MYKLYSGIDPHDALVPSIDGRSGRRHFVHDLSVFATYLHESQRGIDDFGDLDKNASTSVFAEPVSFANGSEGVQILILLNIGLHRFRRCIPP